MSGGPGRSQAGSLVITIQQAEVVYKSSRRLVPLLKQFQSKEDWGRELARSQQVASARTAVLGMRHNASSTPQHEAVTLQPAPGLPPPPDGYGWGLTSLTANLSHGKGGC